MESLTPDLRIQLLEFAVMTLAHHIINRPAADADLANLAITVMREMELGDTFIAASRFH